MRGFRALLPRRSQNEDIQVEVKEPAADVEEGSEMTDRYTMARSSSITSGSFVMQGLSSRQLLPA